MSEQKRRHLAEIEAGIPFEFQKKCIWKEENGIDSDGTYVTGCDNMFTILEGNPRDNNFKFCPYCGNKLKEKETE